MLLATVTAAMLSAALIRIIRPLLLKHAMARPNARSSHRLPTPQGAGIAVMAATLAVAGVIAVQHCVEGRGVDEDHSANASATYRS